MFKSLTIQSSLYLLFLVICSGCHTSVDKGNSSTSRPANLLKTYSNGKGTGPEQFDGGIKDSFQLGSIELATGPWLFDDAILAHSNKDARFYKQSVRIRNYGAITTQFNVQGISYLKVNHAAFGTDQPSNWQLLMSEDSGKTFRQIGKTVTSSSHTLTSALFTINSNKSLRFEIRKVSGGNNCINIDNVIFCSPLETFENSVNIP